MLLTSGPLGRPKKKKIRTATAELREKFRQKFQHEKCLDLIEPYQDKRQARLQNCQQITGVAAELAARIILKYRPQLAAGADQVFLKNYDSKLSGLLKKVLPL
jgi:flagellar biosynthesis/type III secretory pathway protein FliH